MPKTLRLNFPQWQGANMQQISAYAKEIALKEFAQGYYLGAQLLQFLAPHHQGPEETVSISLDYTDHALQEENGIASYQILQKQFQEALDKIEQHRPDKILTLGGECSVSLAPFSYLAKRYQNDIALIWIDAHPDLNTPRAQAYTGFHAMVQAALLGKGDAWFIDKLPATLSADKALIVGLNGGEGEDLPTKFAVSVISADEVNLSSESVLAWLKATGVKHVMVHFDLDAINAQDLWLGVPELDSGLQLESAERLIHDIAKVSHLVGLSIAEYMPRALIRLRQLLHNLPI